jgi:signal recognition particle receptor subunit beta
MVDTPGHGKLRSEQALSQLTNPAVRGVVFMVDSTALESSTSEVARDSATYLHDLLVALQRRKTGKVKVKTEIPVLLAANKQDLFTALPAGAIKERLQTQLEKIRRSKTRGVTSVDADPDAEEEDDTLGGGGEDLFSFKLMEEEYGITIDVAGGAVRGEEAGKGVRKWEEWIGSCL